MLHVNTYIEVLYIKKTYNYILTQRNDFSPVQFNFKTVIKTVHNHSIQQTILLKNAYNKRNKYFKIRLLMKILESVI